MNTTKILGEAVGIQSQGIVDKTETQTNEGLTSALIIGRFKRGRIDKPMTIHQGNIRGQLGYEPNNIDYIAVQDCLDTGVPSIQVLRVGATSNGSLISCAGATSVMSFSYIAGVWDVYVDDMETPFATGNIGAVLSALSLAYLNRINADYDGVMMLENIDNVPHRLKFIPVSNTSYTPNLGDNPTFVDDGNGGFYFCLNPQQSLISCDGATNSVVFEEDPDFTSWGSINSIVINDTEYAKPESIPEGELLPLNPTPDGDQIRISISGGHPYQKLMFENLGARPARVKIKTKQDWSGSNLANANLHSSNDNPTVVGDGENFEVRFCLAILS